MGKERLSAIRRFARARRGATAIEFAMIAIPFFMLIFAIIEVAFIFFATTVIENAVVVVSRAVKVGTVTSEQQFRDALCERIRMVADCDDIIVDVRTVDSFGDGPGADDDPDDDDDLPGGGQSNRPERVNDLLSDLFGGQDAGMSDPQFDPGAPGDIVIARTLLEWQVMIPNLGLGLANGPDNTRLIMGSAAFRNEPFTEETGG